MKKISTTLAILAALQLAGCTAPQSVEFAPLIQLNDSANGNTVPIRL
ncbi:MAG TPA: hypothetical protein PKI68_01010 [Pontiellaceae bacterium]|nr:hypothetical protein [Pontiellaceae bacterium]